MAKFNNLAAAFLVLCILLMISTAASAKIRIGLPKPKAAPECDTVYGAEDGDTCTSVAQQFKLRLSAFSAINPNLNCDSIFIGQWLCVEGTA